MLNSALQEYRFESNPIRTVMGKDGEPWFVAADVCKVLDINNSRQALTRLDDDEKDVTTNDTPGGQQQIATINESGLYSLILTSRKPEAKRFKKWVTSEVLPAIRKTGAYSVVALSPAQALLKAVEQLVEHEQRLTEHDQRLKAIESRQTASEEGVRYFSVLAYFIVKGLPGPSLNQALSIGKRATALSSSRGFTVGRTDDPRFGHVNTYHESILDEVLNRV